MKDGSVDYFSGLSFKKRYELAENLRHIFYKLHPLPKEGFFASFSNMKEYLDWKKNSRDK